MPRHWWLVWAVFWFFERAIPGRLTLVAQLSTVSLLIALALAGILVNVSPWFCVLPLALALPCAIQVVANFSLLTKLVQGIVRQRRWDLALLGLSPLLLAGAYWQVISLTEVEGFDLLKNPQPMYNHQKAAEIGYTDRQRPIALFELSPESRERFSLVGDKGLSMTGTPLPYRAIRLSEASGSSNCVGWVFCGGLHEMQCQDVNAILEDNGYQEVQTPQVGDLVIYRDENQAINHAGTVGLFHHGKQPLIESKWGMQGVFLHLPEGSPFGTNWTYYRSSRSNKHLLNRTTSPATPADSVDTTP